MACGVLTVPEDYSKPAGREVKLPFIIYKAIPGEDTYPLVVAGGGGPGSAIGIAPDNKEDFNESLWHVWYASTIEAGRDLILIDNRGVGSSLPRLACPEVNKVAVDTLNKDISVDDSATIVKQAYGACRERLTGQGVDVSQYHVTNAARDIEELRIALGESKLNVYGISYGTRVSLEYERLYPESVRSLILDGVYPQSAPTFEDEPRLNLEALLRVIEKCRADIRCQSAFAFDFEDRLKGYLKQLEINPVTVRITNPETFDPIEVLVTPNVFFETIYSMMYDENVIAVMPKYMYASFRGNTDYLTEMVRDYYVREMFIDPLDVGAYASYSCFDEIPFTDYAAARSAISKYPFQHYANVYYMASLEAMCEVWNVPKAEASFKEPYKIDTPVLIYSGELDPVTPAELAKSVVENARVSWALKWPNISHGVMFVSECADWTAQAFLKAPESNPFVYECSDEIVEFIFEIR